MDIFSTIFNMHILERPHPNNSYYKSNQSFHVKPDGGGIFVFGSNLKGLHGAGAAKTAHRLYGALYGFGKGFKGQSYAIPTKDHCLQTLPLPHIKRHVESFVSTTSIDDNTWYLVTAVGCGLAGYEPHQIAPLFKGAVNCWFPDNWRPFLKPT